MEKHRKSVRLALTPNDKPNSTQNYIVSMPNASNMSEPEIAQKIRVYVAEFREIFDAVYYNKLCGVPIPQKYTEKQLHIVHRILVTQDKLTTASFIHYMHEVYDVDFVKEKEPVVPTIVLPVIHD